jgi:hypothetical protein
MLVSTCEEDLSLMVLRKSQTPIFLEKVIQFQSLWNKHLGLGVIKTRNLGCSGLWLGGTGFSTLQ